jgi:hypothetical protein
MTRPPGPLRPGQEQEVVRQIGVALASQVPPGWRQLRIEYRAASRPARRGSQLADPVADAVRLFGVLRSGIHQLRVGI